ncbi:MAG: hypothetical protein ACRCZ0_08260 [Cetobacterium sp.]
MEFKYNNRMFVSFRDNNCSCARCWFEINGVDCEEAKESKHKKSGVSLLPECLKVLGQEYDLYFVLKEDEQNEVDWVADNIKPLFTIG